ncbi:hypothetical protein [Aurantiacibacter poecillastricola]|uniref:hypothetical protein n=1 Tax=Aurantiacibacter poecillastricola TaxID=3064385 RepID=UPI00273F87B9|nr:hypothetical protein [Aurantiacibacter sp. 219JJ12-13]MDP5260026.1 hypothetical protein [Aurantiacibacter sp. 219JJ12-13]
MFILRVLYRLLRLFPSKVRQNISHALYVGEQMARFTQPVRIVYHWAFAPRYSLLAHPGVPSHHQTLFKLCAWNHCRIVTDPGQPHDLAIHFANDPHRCEMPAGVPTINRHCDDVSKSHIADVFERIFGYAIAVDPQFFDGRMVEKPEGNHSFEGRILQGPLTSDEVRIDRVYERFIDTHQDGHAIDLRTPVYGSKIPVVYEKRIPANAHMKEVKSARMRQTNEVFSAEEQSRLIAFAEALGLEYGEMDVLRDNRSGKIYVVDVNNTPAGPPKQMSNKEIAAALKVLSPAFMELIRSHIRTLSPAD